MTTPSLYSQTGLSIHADVPLTTGLGSSSQRLTEAITSYEHEIAALGGYKSAQFVINDKLVDIEDWFENGLGRHIEVYNSGMVKVWEGFVNNVTINAGSLQASRGPLMQVANFVTVVYSEIIDPDTEPPTVGTRGPTIAVQDTDSQAKYGIIEVVLDGGTCLADDAERYRDTFLENNKDPVTSETITPGRGQGTGVTVECLGYWSWLQAFVYADATAVTQTLTAKIQAVLGTDPNGIISTDYTNIDTNGYLTARWEDENSTGWDVILALIALGDVNDDRWTFGIYNDQKAHYGVIPSTPFYQHRIASESQRIETYAGNARVFPWDVRPAQWMFLPDFLVGRVQPTELRLDPRYVFIESIRYRAPWEVEINGSKVGTLGQVMAQLGLGGAA
jgi:hypothetical protein